ncbi:Hint domain-containing protein [Micromonospora sp. CPCC 205371]|nr:Hint domain-containing protein [Micromonospora sp. CPCC 205371]
MVGPTSVGVTNPAVGTNVYNWPVPAPQAPGDYLVSWSGTDPGTGDPVPASEIITVATAAAEGSPLGVCEPWPVIWCPNLPTGSEAVTGAALQAATEALWAATAQRFGLCTETIRPCRRSCGAFWPFADSWWEWTGGMWPRPLLYDGAWYNITCGSCAGGCQCGMLEEALLPGPVYDILEVKVDGTPLPMSAYRLDMGRLLVRTDGGRWPTCFVAGTLILTDRGLCPIEEIEPGQMVLTHRNRWRRVVAAKMTGISETVRIHGRGGSVRCTPDHRFWSAEVYTEQSRISGRQKRVRKLGSPEWTQAADLVGRATATPARVEPLPIPLPEGWEWADLPANFWWFVGRWIGDGWTDTTGAARVSICCGVSETEQLADALRETGWAWHQNGGGGGAARFRFSSPPLYAWLRQEFGTAAHNKRIPAWLLGADEDVRRAFLAGYVSADGWHGPHSSGRGRPSTSVHTVSRSLALGTRLLAATLGHSATVHQGHASQLSKRPTYRINWPEGGPGEPYAQSWSDDSHLWGRVRRVELDEVAVPVYDLEVEEDHSFVADGFVVHNCQHLELPDTAVGTWSVTARFGEPVPILGQQAVGELACEMVHAMLGEDCRLPKNVQQLVRQGVTISFPEDSDLVDRLYFAGMFIKAFNPSGLVAKPQVYDVDGPMWRRVVG